VRLKTLEIKGFKSFADKTVLNFDERITGVVGPNGCGKSNIVDSIRWVIGEHKISNLRSENLEGLVFNGSKSRSASGLAEVSLTFENTRNVLPTEFTTVTITRKFFKNGESEYRLNDVACRLKDIHNLFMDTGVSTDSYAIIELGMVDDIIKDKEASRRRMLEQAAGISIYKTRKKEARQKLEATESDLNRIEDLLFEINNNLKTLESQARKAEKYFEVKKEYKVVSIELAKAALEGFHLSFKELTEQQESEMNKKIELEAVIAQGEASVEQDKLYLIEKEKELQELQNIFNELNVTIRTRENDKSLANQQLTYLQERAKSLREFLSGAEGQLQGLHQSIGFTKSQAEEEKQQLDNMQGELQQLKEAEEAKQTDWQYKRAALDNARQAQQQIQREQFESEKKVAVTDTSVQNLQRSIHQTEEEKKQREIQIQQLQDERNELEITLGENRSYLQELIAQHEQTKAKILTAQQEIESLREQLVKENRQLDARKNEHDLLKSLIENLEGYPESIKFLKKNSEWNNQTPILSDIFFCKEEYRTAIENLLEPYLNYYVADHAADAIRAIQLLDNHKKGKANFFLLDQFGPINENGVQTPGNTIPVLDVVEIDDKYKSLGNYLLGKVFITDDAGDIHPDEWQDKGIVIIEKSGRIFRSKYYLGGGSIGLFEGKKLGRAKNLEKIQATILQMESIVAALQQQVKERHEQVLILNNELNEKLINTTKDKINQLQQQDFSLQNKIENFIHLVDSGNKRLAEMQQQLEMQQQYIASYREMLQSLNDKFSQVQRLVTGAETAHQEAEKAYSQVHEQFNIHNLQFTRQQSKVQGLQQELEFKEKQLHDLEQQITSNTSQLAEAENNISLTNEQLNKVEEALVVLFRRREDEQKILGEKEQAYYHYRNQLNEKESNLRHQHKNKEQTELLLNSIKDKVNELKLQLASMKERLSVEFRINLDEIIDEPRTGNATTEQLQLDAEKMKKRLDNMGEINPTAIEAYQEMKKRFEFIQEQKNDLVSAKESLLTTIQEVEITANQRFLETFSQVKENFIKVYRTLSAEDDQCDLILVDPENLSETSIDIIAKPKGKRPTSIGQLSMGEKTLVATALLFAIYLIKPAPFCILDEVDAPLDDMNVSKFTNMIREFSGESQFIIVTHNKQTMAAVDVIYGVTMQEAGVSKLVPVDFRSLN
jgi:chromosome segregation protein